MNLPLAARMRYSFFREIPKPILEATYADGATLRQKMLYLLLPLAGPGIASTAPLCVIFTWNEAFSSLNLTATHAGTLATFITGFLNPQALF